MDSQERSSISSAERRPEFIGWVDYITTTSAWFCTPNHKFQFSDNRAGCCSATDCLVYTRCIGGDTIVDATSGTSKCASSESCSTLTILETAVDSGTEADQSTRSRIECYPGPSIYTIFRTYPELLGGSETGTAGTMATKITGTTATSDTRRTHTGLEDESGSEKGGDSLSNGWIAGAVIGPLALLVFTGFLVFWIVRKRSQKRVLAQTTPTTPHHAQHRHELPGVDEQEREIDSDPSTGTQSPLWPRCNPPSSTGRSELQAESGRSELQG